MAGARRQRARPVWRRVSITETTRTLRRGVVRLYPERDRRIRRQVALILTAGALSLPFAYHAGRLLFLLIH